MKPTRRIPRQSRGMRKESQGGQRRRSQAGVPPSRWGMARPCRLGRIARGANV